MAEEAARSQLYECLACALNSDHLWFAHQMIILQNRVERLANGCFSRLVGNKDYGLDAFLQIAVHTRPLND